MLEAIPDNYELSAVICGADDPARVAGIQVEHRKYGTEGQLIFRIAATYDELCEVSDG